jgi:hypothetical protein
MLLPAIKNSKQAKNFNLIPKKFTKLSTVHKHVQLNKHRALAKYRAVRIFFIKTNREVAEKNDTKI